ncbi:hypothetical protein SBOR_6441 [Sclerotinia borealis F-4128]|uniref:Uncharacterized protein n=1 Tax=Sclerotinia borealis (strain F-4128) TaxID=1432307 RepID=W9C8T1_SCLBF|nr:hypothetical protein SBOR_6441 [Sclerotinia borealis F-4128]
MSARSARIRRLAGERYEELIATGKSLEALEFQVRMELDTYPNFSENAAQICKSVVSRIQEARTSERATTSTSPSSPEVLQLMTPEASATPKPAPTKIVVLKIKDGHFTPTVLPSPDARETVSTTPARVVWSITKRNVEVNLTLSINIPTTICPKTAEYVGTNLTSDQQYFNSLARTVGTKKIIEARVKFGLEEGYEDLELATRRAHSLAECQVNLYCGYLREKRGKEVKEANKKQKIDV